MEDFQTSDIRRLANLLSFEKDNDSDVNNSDYLSTTKRDLYAEQINKNIEGNNKNPIAFEKKPNIYSKLDKSKDIWDDDEVPDEDYDEIKKEEPKYEMFYQQNITPDGIFLQFHGKGPDSNSCECLLVKIKLEDINSSDEITLKISAVSVKCKTDKYYLDLNLPKHVDPEKCSAKWNQSSGILEVKLQLDDKELFL